MRGVACLGSSEEGGRELGVELCLVSSFSVSECNENGCDYSVKNMNQKEKKCHLAWIYTTTQKRSVAGTRKKSINIDHK